jgi:transposase
LLYEWAGDGKEINDFEKEGPKIVIVLDNASIHKKEEFVETIRTEMPNLVLEFLPAYSPDYNLIEGTSNNSVYGLAESHLRQSR